ncbi:MAG: hypothetical protein ACR2KQ_02255 [Actinomycetota bacterium]
MAAHRNISGKIIRTLTATALLGGLLTAPLPSRAQTTTSCTKSGEPTPEVFGPTDISATSGNQRLSVALNKKATVTVMKWPSPSYFDQIKYRTTDRSQPRLGALPNEGALIGVAWKPDPGRDPDGPAWGFSWLRRWPSKQRFGDDDSDEVVTTFRKRNLGLKATVRDLVTSDHSTFLRKVAVKRTKASPVRAVRIFAFTNYNPVVSKTPQAPTNDWCSEQNNDTGAFYDAGADAILHVRSGFDESTDQPSSVALAVGFKDASRGHQVGPDTYQFSSTGQSAYDDARDGALSGRDEAAGQADAALFQQRSLQRSRAASSTIVMAAEATEESVLAQLDRARARSFKHARGIKAAWWRDWLRTAELPKGAPRPVRKLSKRALISLRQTTDASTGLVSTSIATQEPLGFDRIRDAAYTNRALQAAGHPEMVQKRNVRLGELQATTFSKPTGGTTTPAGNWATGYYADGVVAGSRTHEVDETGLGIWLLWDHYRATGDSSYLGSSAVYEAIQGAAHYLSDDAPFGCRDPATGLLCLANDEQSANPRQALVAAQAAWLGLGAAVKAARVRGNDIALQNATKWETRRKELGAAIKANYRNQDCDCFATDYRVGGTFLWPVGFVGYRSKTAAAQAAENWKHIRRAMRGKDKIGDLEARALLGNAYVWTDATGKRKLRKALKWLAGAPTTGPTKLLGRSWMQWPKEDGRITPMVSQPHVWHMSMYYLAALKVYGSEGWSD